MVSQKFKDHFALSEVDLNLFNPPQAVFKEYQNDSPWYFEWGKHWCKIIGPVTSGNDASVNAFRTYLQLSYTDTNYNIKAILNLFENKSKNESNYYITRRMFLWFLLEDYQFFQSSPHANENWHNLFNQPFLSFLRNFFLFCKSYPSKTNNLKITEISSAFIKDLISENASEYLFYIKELLRPFKKTSLEKSPLIKTFTKVTGIEYKKNASLFSIFNKEHLSPVEEFVKLATKKLDFSSKNKKIDIHLVEKHLEPWLQQRFALVKLDCSNKNKKNVIIYFLIFLLIAFPLHFLNYFPDFLLKSVIIIGLIGFFICKARNVLPVPMDFIVSLIIAYFVVLQADQLLKDIIIPDKAYLENKAYFLLIDTGLLFFSVCYLYEYIKSKTSLYETKKFWLIRTRNMAFTIYLVSFLLSVSLLALMNYLKSINVISDTSFPNFNEQGFILIAVNWTCFAVFIALFFQIFWENRKGS